MFLDISGLVKLFCLLCIYLHAFKIYGEFRYLTYVRKQIQKLRTLVNENVENGERLKNKLNKLFLEILLDKKKVEGNIESTNRQISSTEGQIDRIKAAIEEAKNRVEIAQSNYNHVARCAEDQERILRTAIREQEGKAAGTGVLTGIGIGATIAATVLTGPVGFVVGSALTGTSAAVTINKINEVTAAKEQYERLKREHSREMENARDEVKQKQRECDECNEKQRNEQVKLDKLERDKIKLESECRAKHQELEELGKEITEAKSFLPIITDLEDCLVNLEQRYNMAAASSDIQCLYHPVNNVYEKLCDLNSCAQIQGNYQLQICENLIRENLSNSLDLTESEFLN